MKNSNAIMAVARQLMKTCDQIMSLAAGVAETEQFGEELPSALEGLLLDEVEHSQVLTLEMTKLVAGTEEVETVNADEGSIFAAGDLNYKKGENAVEHPGDEDSE